MSERPTSSGTTYPVPWIATYLVTGFFLIAASVGIAWYLDRPSSKFDYDDPDMRFLEGIVLSPDPREGDFSKLNGGDWRALCLVGFGGNIQAALDAAGIGGGEAEGMTSAIAEFHEALAGSEFLFVYADGSGTAKALHHPHGFAFARRGAALCTPRDRPVLALPVLAR